MQCLWRYVSKKSTIFKCLANKKIIFSIIGTCEDDAKVVEACPVWAGHNECSENPTFMLKNCRKSCNVCRGKFSAIISGFLSSMF